MRSTRKLAVMGLLAWMAFVSSASALTAVDATTNTALAVGSWVNGHSTNSTLTGVFLGIGTSVSCSTSAVVGMVKSNNGTTVAGSIDQLSFSGCVNEVTQFACTVGAQGLAWNPTTSGGNAAGLIVTGLATAPTVNIGTGANGILISGTNCLPASNTCTFQGGTAGPLSSGAYGISNYVSGPFSNSASTVTFTNVAVKSSTCGSGDWTATYTLKTGSTVGSGNPIKFV